MVIAEIWRQFVGIKVIQQLNFIIPTIGMETIVASTTNFIKSGVLIGSTFNLGHGLGRVLAKRNLNRSSKVLVATTGVVY